MFRKYQQSMRRQRLNPKSLSSNWKPNWLGIWQGWRPAGDKIFLISN